MSLKSRLLYLALLLLLTGVATAVAQEFWLLPPRFFVAAGTRQSIHLVVGHNLSGTRWPGKSSRLVSLVQYAPGAPVLDHTAPARQADTLSTTVEFSRPGVHLLALRTTNSFAEFSALAFNTYLKQEGLDNVLSLRQQRGEFTSSAREAYCRCAKTLVQVGPNAAPDTARAFAAVAGHPLELVPEQNPYALPEGASLTVLVLAAGLPQRGALVQLWHQLPGQPVQLFKLHSNQNGRVLFKLQGAGTYLLSTVQMEPAADPKTADWQSTWATLTFGRAGISGR